MNHHHRDHIKQIKPSCNAIDCFFPSNKKEFGIRMCLYIFGLILSSCLIIYNRACGLYNLWTVVLWFISVIEIIILFIAYLKFNRNDNKCLQYGKDCNNKIFNLLK